MTTSKLLAATMVAGSPEPAPQRHANARHRAEPPPRKALHDAAGALRRRIARGTGGRMSLRVAERNTTPQNPRPDV